MRVAVGRGLAMSATLCQEYLWNRTMGLEQRGELIAVAFIETRREFVGQSTAVAVRGTSG